MRWPQPPSPRSDYTSCTVTATRASLASTTDQQVKSAEQRSRRVALGEPIEERCKSLAGRGGIGEFRAAEAVDLVAAQP